MKNNFFYAENLFVNNSDGYKLENFNFNLHEGEIHALVGERGAGKGTFINTIAGYFPLIEGKVYYKNKIINSELSLNNSNRIEFLLQESRLIENLTIAENLFLGDYPKKNFSPFINYKKIYCNAEKILTKLNIKIDCNKKVEELIREERKLIDIAKVFSRNPDVVFMHEPSTELGSDSVMILFDILNYKKDEGVSIVYITNKWEEALKISDRISVITGGKLIGTMKVKEAKKDPRRLLYMMSGWGNYTEGTEIIRDETKEVMEAVFKAAEFLTSDYELYDVLQLLSKYIVKIMNADCCFIYLLNEDTNSILDVVEYKKEQTHKCALKKEKIVEIIAQNDLYYTTDSEKNFSSFFNIVEGIKTVICFPVLARLHITGIIQVSYSNYYVYSKEEIKYLSTLARHVAIAVEDTRLMGRSALLQESHHRIKNNLQSIIGLINLQEEYSQKNPDQSTEDLINNITTRIKSIAAVHDLLSRDKLGRSIINLNDITLAILNFYDNQRNIDIELDQEDIFIPYNKATAIALILNELLSNCYKHAFKGMKGGQIKILCKKYEKSIKMVIHDNGVGIHEDFDLQKINSLGLTIVNSIIENEFKGKMLISKQNGTKINIVLSLDEFFSSA